MKLQYIFYLAIFLFSLNACENRKDPYYGIDTGPVLEVSKINKTLFTTQIQDSDKLGHIYSFAYLLQSFEDLKLKIEKSNIYDSLQVNNGNNTINVMPSSPEEATYNLSVVDPFEKSAQANVQLTVFKNLIPIAVFTDTVIAQLNPYQIQINASRSYDQDARWGGEVVRYKFQIDNNYTCITPLSTIEYICEFPGQKQITVTVQDNDSAWSVPVTKYLLIN